MKALMSEAGCYQGMLEYIPGKYAHRPVEAEGYMFIHCLFVGFRSEFKGKGYGTLLIKTDTDRIFDNPDCAGKSPKSAAPDGRGNCSSCPRQRRANPVTAAPPDHWTNRLKGGSLLFAGLGDAVVGTVAPRSRQADRLLVQRSGVKPRR
jgi:hypothetical protein